MRILACIVIAAGVALGSSSLLAQPATTQAVDHVQQTIAALRERKLPATFADLAPAPVPNDKNAALDIEEAAVMTAGDDGGPSSSSLSFSEQLPYPKEWFDLARRNALANREAADLLHAARMKAAIAWPNPPTAPLDDWMKAGLGSLANFRQLANVTKDIALVQHFSGEESQAIESLRDLEFLGQAGGHKPFVVAQLVSVGILAMQAHATQVIAAELKVAPAADPQGVAQRAAVKALIADLLDDAKLRSAYRRGILEERTILIEGALAGDAASSRPAQWADRIAAYDAMAHAVDKNPWEKLDPIDAIDAENWFGSSDDRFRHVVWQTIALRRMAAASLACALYRNDHGGYPPDLAALVPAYLDKIPVDPFARDGAPLRYAIVDKGTRPLIGTVGPDGQPTAPGLHQKAAYCGSHITNGPDDTWLDLTPWQEH